MAGRPDISRAIPRGRDRRPDPHRRPPALHPRRR
jgi:hypothetical protein